MLLAAAGTAKPSRLPIIIGAAVGECKRVFEYFLLGHDLLNETSDQPRDLLVEFNAWTAFGSTIQRIGHDLDGPHQRLHLHSWYLLHESLRRCDIPTGIPQKYDNDIVSLGCSSL